MLFQLQQASLENNENRIQSDRINALTTSHSDRANEDAARPQNASQVHNLGAVHNWPNSAHVTQRPASTEPVLSRRDARTIAVLIDFENIVQNDKNLIGDVLKEIAAAGRIVIRRAYGDWGRFSQHKHDLCKQGVELIEMPAGCARKNSADMQLAADGMDWPSAVLILTRLWSSPVIEILSQWLVSCVCGAAKFGSPRPSLMLAVSSAFTAIASST